MEFDFQCLIYKYTLPGAREKFESICTRLLQRIHAADAHNIRPSQGDGGIDIMVGEQVWQCKFFPNGIGDAQKNQIRKSFHRAMETPGIKRWTLCLPVDLTKKEMDWWSEWEKKQEKPELTIELWDGSYLLNLLRDQGLYEEVFGGEREEQPELLTKWMVDSAAKACTDENVHHYYKVDHRFEVMLRVIAADRDVPHIQAVQTVDLVLKQGRSVILGGNSGMGKTSLMLRCAVEWARKGKPVLWLALNERDKLTEVEARRMRTGALDTMREGEQLLVCIDDPYENLDSLASLRKVFLDDPQILVLLAERSNRLIQMADASADCFSNWLEDAAVVTMEGLYPGKPLKLGMRETILCAETGTRRERVLLQCLQDLENQKKIPRNSSYDIQRQVLRRFGKPNITLVELIYRALVYVKEQFSVGTDIRLDWEEWKRFIRLKMEKNVSDARLYGVIAACSVFDVPMTLRLFTRIFGLQEAGLAEALRLWKETGNVEPVLYRQTVGSRGRRSGTLRPKHNVVAELFFELKKLTPDGAMGEVLKNMTADEAEGFLRNLISSGKWTIQNGRRGQFNGIDYDEMLMQLLDRQEAGELGLTAEGLALLLLGLLWTIPKGDRSGRSREVLEILEDLAPPIMDGLTFAMLYTEWGKLLADNRKPKDAEDKLRLVAEQFPKQLHARTELGRLLSKQPGREEEAEAYLKEAIRIDPKNLHPHTELGRLLSKQPGREGEAEQYLREILQIDPKNIQTRTELGRLLSKQPGREGEAEQYLREILQIDPKNIQTRTELGRLLSKQPGREEEAEAYLKEAIQIDPKGIHSRTELGRLLSKQPGREGEAEAYLKEAIRIDPKHIQSRTELGRLLSKQPGREGEAEKFLREILTLDRNNCHARVVLAEMICKDRPAEAERLYREVLRMDKGNKFAKEGLEKMGITP